MTRSSKEWFGLGLIQVSISYWKKMAIQDMVQGVTALIS